MKLDDFNVRRGLLRKLFYFSFGALTIKSSDASKSEDVSIPAHSSALTKPLSLSELSKIGSSAMGELVFVTHADGDINHNNNSSFPGFFFSSIQPVDRIDGFVSIQGYNCIWNRVLGERVYVDWFGALGDGVNDDSQAIHLANLFASSKGLPLFFSPNKKYMLSRSFEIDVAKTSWHGGDNIILQWTKSPGEHALRVFSSQSVYSRTRVNNKVALCGFSILGGGMRNLYSSKAISIGGSEKSSSLFALKNLSIQGWSVNLFFDDNSWRIKIEDCLFLWGTIRSKPKAINSGESMFFSNCMFADDFSYTELYMGDWHYASCSIDNHQIKVYGDASIYFDNGHIENPGRKNNKFTAIGIYSKDGSASVTNTRLVISETPKIISTPIFYVADNNKSLGLYINNLRYDQRKNFDPSVSDCKGIFIVGGDGKVVVDNVFVNMIDENFMALSKNTNLLFINQGFDSGIEGWNYSGHISVQDEIRKVSNYCIKLSGIASVSQTVSIYPGEILTGGVWAKLSTPDNSVLKLSIDYFDAKGVFIDSEGLIINKSGSFDWQWIRLGSITPSDAKSCKFSIELESDSDTQSKAYIDGLVINKTNR